MSSAAQIAANRLNGLKGGVRTEEGKMVSRMNARKHGLYATLMTQHDVRELSDVAEKLAEEHLPVGVTEEMLVEKLAATTLRMQRLNRVEQWHYCTWNETNLDGIKHRCEATLDALGKQEVRLTNQFLKLLRELERRQKERRNAECKVQSAECRMEKKKNEPNLASEPGLALAGKARSVSTSLDSSLHGNDNEETRNEPNSSAMPNAEPAAPAAQPATAWPVAVTGDLTVARPVALTACQMPNRMQK